MPVTDLRKRAHNVLSKANADGRLAAALDKWQEETPAKPPPKKRDRGRGIEAALKLPGEAPSTADHGSRPGSQGQGSRPGSQGMNRRGSVGRVSSKRPAEGGPEEHFITLIDPKTGRTVTQHLHDEFSEPSSEEEEAGETKEEELKRRAEHAKLQAAEKEKAVKSYQKRQRFIDEKLRAVLECLVAGVSCNAEKRPENPVPLMIEMLAEYSGKNLAAFNAGPANRLRREIRQLQKEVDALEDRADELSEYETESEDEEDDQKSP